jgi:hypothetical protein
LRAWEAGRAIVARPVGHDAAGEFRMRSIVLAAIAVAIGGPASAQASRHFVGLDAAAAISAAHNAGATTGAFAIGMRIHDSRGALVGRITRLTTDSSGQTVAMVRLGSETFGVPTSELTMRGTYAVSGRTAQQLRERSDKR